MAENTDQLAEAVIDESGLVHIDGLTIGRRRVINGRVILEVKDRFNGRAITMRRRFVRVDIRRLYEAMIALED